MDRRVQYRVDNCQMCNIITRLERESYGIFLCIGVCFASFSILVLFFSVSEGGEQSDVFCPSFSLHSFVLHGVFCSHLPLFFFFFFYFWWGCFFSLFFFDLFIVSFFFCFFMV